MTLLNTSKPKFICALINACQVVHFEKKNYFLFISVLVHAASFSILFERT